MAGLLGKIIKTQLDIADGTDHVLGKRLKALRELAGLSTHQLCEKLAISARSLARLENSADISLDTIKRYVESLGAQLHINAAFGGDSPVVCRVAEAFDLEVAEDVQLVLPIFSEDEFRDQRDVVLSIKPQYSSKILQREKTVELRRRFPVNVPDGTLAYIYSTTPEKALVGFAEIESVTKKPVVQMWKEHGKAACISKQDFNDYFSGQEFGFALRFRTARPFKEVIQLNELRERFGFEPPQSFVYAKPLLREALRYELAELPH